MALQLIPNKVVGYRIKPDWYSFNVVLVKLHGDNSKHAGQEYETPVAYCRTVEGAATWIFNHALRTAAELSQAERLSIEKSCADIRGLLDSVKGAREQVFSAVSELQNRIDNLQLSQRELVKHMGAQPDESPE